MPLPETVHRCSLTDLSTFDAMIGDARVVAIGENNHHIREFGLLRDRILRHLITERGFGVLAFESGFAEGRLVDAWINGGSGDIETVASAGFTFRFGESAEVRDMLGWLREHNFGGASVRFAGLDIPGSGGSGVPALSRVRDYLATYAPDEVPLADAAIEAMTPYASTNNGAAPSRYAVLSTGERDAATAALSRLLSRMDALRPVGDPREHRIARHHALGALRLDEHLRELAQLGDPDAPVLVSSSRDVYQAETVRLLWEMFGSDERIVLMSHNAHAQRVPMRLVPNMRAYSAGSYLAADLGSDYVAIGVTALDGVTTDARLDDQANDGIDVVSRSLEELGPDSVERAVGDVDEPVLLDLRQARGKPGPVSIRHAYTETPVDVPAAFDGLVCLPTMHPSSFVRDGDQPVSG